MFESFRSTIVETGAAEIFVRHAGEGPPVYLLHGHPRTSATWPPGAPRPPGWVRWPPVTLAYSPLAVLRAPPLTLAKPALAVLPYPPLTVA